MPFNINSFKTNIVDYGYLPTNKFELFLSPPAILRNSNINTLGTDAPVERIIKNHQFRINQIRAPGVNLSVVDNAVYGIGTNQKFPVNAQFNDMSFEIFSDGYGEIWQFWHNWINTIFGFTSTTNAATGQANKFASYTAKYKDEYSTTIQLRIYDNFGNDIQNFNFFEAFPISLREVPLSWGASNDMIKLTVGLTYKEHTIDGSSVTKNLNTLNSGVSSTGFTSEMGYL
jgi:hypothetical protein